ncbi:MAG: tannase/feruloyl esterase family alpha/beta hydrolase [Acidobacteria bacterium]|nr:tannase/feruloyl esterase family alpha/beta hydrolase [Acidobacteriota bacterium]
MNRRTGAACLLVALASSLLCHSALALAAADEAVAKEEAACTALANLPNLTLLSAQLVNATGSTPAYCYVRGVISPAIHYHVQLPLPSRWNGRFLNWGDGGKDGDLDFADHRVAQGYAVANSNTGHDIGSEPGASFAYNNRQAEIDFAYRAIRLTVTAAKTLVKAYYGKAPQYSYHEGCSQGGRQGLIEAQRYPYDFDGIVAGAPVNFYQAMHAGRIWTLQRIFRNNLAGNLAFDMDRDGIPESLTKLNMVTAAVLAQCDANDGITDGVVDDPLTCRFRPEADLASKMCPADKDADDCFTRAQIQVIQDIYAGGHDSKGLLVYKGKALGSEFEWASKLIPHAGNSMLPGNFDASGDHMNYLFYEQDPGMPPPELTDLSHVLDKKATPPEYAWWEFNIDDFSAGKATFMSSLTDAADPDLTRFLIKQGGKFILWQGWGDVGVHPEPTLDYYRDVVATTFKGDMSAARERMRLFMFPGMAHCGGGPGPTEWDRLAPLVEWVENGRAPDYIVATHITDGKIDNERKVCAYPLKAVYTGPAGGQNDPSNWVEKNFACR